MDASFRDSRECKLLVDLAAAMDAGDEGAFTDVVKEYDSMSRLDSWKARASAMSRGGRCEERRVPFCWRDVS